MKRIREPIPEGIRIRLETEQEWKDVLQILEDDGWTWDNGDLPTENVKYYKEKLQTIILKKTDRPIITRTISNDTDISTSEFIKQYNGTIEYEDGDWVAVTYAHNWMKEGNVGQLSGRKGNWYIKREEDGAKWYTAETGIRPATKEEIASVTGKVESVITEGDYVIVTEEHIPSSAQCNRGNNGEYKKGQLLLVSSIGESDYKCVGKWVHLVGDKPAISINLVRKATKDEIEQKEANPTQETPERMYKVGDRIRVTKGAYTGYAATVAEIGIGEGLYWVYIDDGNREIMFSGEGGTSNCMEHYIEDPVSAVPWSIVTTDGVTVYEGDRVWWLSHGKHYSGEAVIREQYMKSKDSSWLMFSTYEAAVEYGQKQCGETSTVKESVPERKWKIGDRFRHGRTGDAEVFTIANDKGEGVENIEIQWKNGTKSVYYSPKDIDKYWNDPWIPYTPEPIPVTAENARVGMKVQYQTGIYGNTIKRGDEGTVTNIDDHVMWVKWDTYKGSDLSHRDDEGNSQIITEVTSNSINKSQSQITKTTNNGNIKESNSKDNSSYTSNSNKEEGKDSSITSNTCKATSYIRIHPEVITGQGYYTGKSSPAMYKVQPEVVKGYYRVN